MTKTWPIVSAIFMLIGTFVLIESISQSETLVKNNPFAQFPLTLDNKWEGKELGLEKKVLDVLKLSDYMMRVYVPRVGRGGEDIDLPEGYTEGESFQESTLPVWLYVGFYQSQRTGATYHSPKNCLPGAGWQFMESDVVSIPMPGNVTISINKVLVQKGLNKQVILYWYHDRGRVIASEYWAKIYLVWDAMTRNRTDGSLIRISVPVRNGTVNMAYEQGVAFLRDMWPVLLKYMPDQTIL